MSDDAIQGTLTYDQDIQDLPEEDCDTNDQEQQPGAPVNLLSLNTHATSIPLTRNKTILGRAAGKCSEGAVLDNPRISGAHCEVSSRSMTDVDAAIWIKDTSINGVWINEKRIPKNETLKIFDKDIISFAPGSVNGNFDVPAFMLMDKRIKNSSSPKDTQQQQQSVPKRANEVLKDESTSTADNEASEPDQKKQKTDAIADGVSSKGKEEEDNAFEQEFECGVCHEIMHKAMILQPCLHSFCRGCCKSWLKQSTVCPSCRQEVTQTKRDFKLNSLITLFLKTRPHMERDDVEEDGADSDKSDLVGKRPRHRNRHYDDDDDGEDEYDEDEDNDDYDDGFNGLDYNLRPLPVGFQGAQVMCDCCHPNNNIGYTCPDGVRLAPLAANATFGDYNARLLPQPGHSLCGACRKHVPVIPEDHDLADRFRCKICHIPTCGCSTASVDEKIAHGAFVDHHLNHFEMGLINDYMREQNLTTRHVWLEIKAGMDNGTYYYLGTGPVANPPPAAVAAPANAAAAADGADEADPDNAVDAAALAQAPVPQPAVAIAGVAGVAGAGAVGVAAVQEVRAARARTVKSSDRLCHTCSRDYFSNGPLYQWRKSFDAATLPARALGRGDCWYGRQCRTQHNMVNRAHAERLNHICENIRR
ncbi:MAG: hypothetical protein J3R72DRAFT_431914 [Linnemannia gamsii]|nr:MAG: hypothetical protein J3R72DRAFT_431914 [Linnemannia gamsii]